MVLVDAGDGDRASAGGGETAAGPRGHDFRLLKAIVAPALPVRLTASAAPLLVTLMSVKAKLALLFWILTPLPVPPV